MNNDIKVIDNFLSEEYFKELTDNIVNGDFPWYFVGNMSWVQQDKAVPDPVEYGFAHLIINDAKPQSNWLPLVQPFLDQVMDLTGTTECLRCRGDMVTNKGGPHVYKDHIDYDGEGPYLHNTTTVFYLNESDGDTIIYDQVYPENRKKDWDKLKTVRQTVSPKPNRLLVFPGNIIHNGSSPTKNQRRVIFNTNFF